MTKAIVQPQAQVATPDTLALDTTAAILAQDQVTTLALATTTRPLALAQATTHPLALVQATTILAPAITIQTLALEATGPTQAPARTHLALLA